MAWDIIGNRGTNPNNNFLGTTDNEALVIRTNSLERVRVDTNGNVGIGITNPRAKLDIFSGFDTNALVFGRSAGDYHSISTSFHGEKPRNNYLGFNIEYNSNDIRRVLTLVGDGTVGIGTTSPNYPLHVVNPNGTAIHGRSDLAGVPTGPSGGGLPGGVAIIGENNLTDGVGVRGNADNGTGVDGVSVSGIGVWGHSDSSSGVTGGSVGGTGITGTSTNGSGVAGYSFNVGVYAHNNTVNVGTVNVHNDAYLASRCCAGDFYGDVFIHGRLTKTGGGSFQIDHPLDPANKYLCHSFVESPDMKNIYDGVVDIDANGEAIVELPAWFGALNKDFRYQLTAIGASGPNLYVAEGITDNRFKIAGGTAGMKVSWQVTGIRQDPWANEYRILVEEEKTTAERGYYLHPALYGEPADRGVRHARYPEVERR